MNRILCLGLSFALLAGLSACNRPGNGPPAEAAISSEVPEKISLKPSEEVRAAPEPSEMPTDAPAKAEPDTALTEPTPTRKATQPPPSKQPEPNIAETMEPAAPPAAESITPAATDALQAEPAETEQPKAEDGMINLQITAGEQTFSAKLYYNPATQALVKRLPLTVTMDELNGNEKFYYLTDGLPADPYRPSDIKAGDLMLYGSDCLVLFYESFSTSYSYTRLGFIEDASGLSGALGGGGVEITFRQA